MRARILLPLLAVALLTVSCRQQRELAYVHDATRDSLVSIASRMPYGIQINDILYIYVESQTPEATVAFNQETNKIAVTEAGNAINPGSGNVQGYLVDQEGDIIFPVLGKINVLGMSHDDLADTIENRLRAEGHVLDPTVTVKLMNFRICILGEVKSPGQIMVNGDRLTIFEAISMVGDLTMSGQRENVTVIREENGQRIIGTIDLTSKDVFDSPYYFLHQNDVVYVEPDKRTKRNAERDPIVMTYFSSTVSIISTLTSLLYYILMSRQYIRNS